VILCIDIGNTQTTLGLFNHANLLKTWRVDTQKKATENECRKHLAHKNVSSIMVSSVVPELDKKYENAAQHIPIKFVTSALTFSFKIALPNKRELGADLLANAEAASRLYDAPLIIVDIGTALTICVVNKKKEHVGGIIYPGMQISHDALYTKASKLKPVSFKKPKELIGTTTTSAIQSGLLNGYAILIDGFIDKIKKIPKFKTAKVVGTGGLLPIIKDDIKNIDIINPDLTLWGIYYIAIKNKGIT